MKYFSYVAMVALLATQAFPTFGNILGHAGNILPLAVGGVIAFVAVALNPAGPGSLNGRQGLALFNFAMLVPMLLIIGEIGSGAPSYSLSNELGRYGAFALFLYLGVQVGRRENGLRLLLWFLSISFIFNAVLFLAFMFDPMAGVIEYYRTRVIGGISLGRARFSGAWNYPYNLSVFLVGFLGAILAWCYKGGKSAVALGVGAAIVSIAMILFGQARSSLFALGFAILAFLLLMSLRFALVGGLSRAMFALSVGCLIAGVIGVSLFYLNVEAMATYVSRLSGVFLYGGVFDSGQRSLQAQGFLSHFSSNPFALLFGEASDIRDDVTQEMALLYITMQGLFGAFFFVVVPTGWMLYRSIGVFVSKRSGPDDVKMALVLFFVGVSIVGHLVSTAIFYHFRFIPMVAFTLGVALVVLHGKGGIAITNRAL